MRKPRIGLDGRKTHFLTGTTRGEKGNFTLKFSTPSGRRPFTPTRAREEAEVICAALYSRVPYSTIQELGKLITAIDDYGAPPLPEEVMKWCREKG